MAIARVNIPTPTAPVGVADYQAQLDQITALNQAFTGRNPVDGSTIRAGTVMMVGSVLYKATSDTAITGTPSLYVKITPSGATASASFVASLPGVTWNHAYGGYYDGGSPDSLYLFDEALAYATGVIGSYHTMGSRLIHGNQIIANSIPSTRMAPYSKITYHDGGTIGAGTTVMPDIEIGQTMIAVYASATTPDLKLPATGTYDRVILGTSPNINISKGLAGGAATGVSLNTVCIYTRTA